MYSVYLRFTSVNQKGVMGKVGPKAEFESAMRFVQTKRIKCRDDHRISC